MKAFLAKPTVQKIVAALLSIFFGLIFGFLILLVASLLREKASYPFDAFYTIFTGGLRYTGFSTCQ